MKKQNAFTLIELLISTTLIVLILSATYGTWIATAQSAANIKSTIATAPIHRSIKTQLTRQLRGIHNEKFFIAQNNPADGIILQFITSSSFFFGKDQTKNLLAARFRFSNQQLDYQQQPYLNQKKIKWTAPWHPVTDQIESIEIQCHNQKKWTTHWEKKSLPNAIKITYLTTNDKTHTITTTLNTQQHEANEKK